MENSMRFAAAAIVLLAAVFLAPSSARAMKKAPYPEVKVQAPAPFKADAALDAMRKALTDAAHRKDAKALFALVSPDFAWTADGEPAEQSDAKQDALTNFKVAFGFREFGKTEDSDPAGAFWVLLDEAGSDNNLTPQDNNPEIACGPATASVVDEDAWDQATEEIAGEEGSLEWVYTLKEIALTEKPTGGGTVAKVSGIAMPVVSRYPAPKAGENLPTSFYEVLLPSGKSGWIDADGVDPLAIDRICYGKDKTGAWKIVGYEQNS
jgi:hypothetical protein